MLTSQCPWKSAAIPRPEVSRIRFLRVISSLVIIAVPRIDVPAFGVDRVSAKHVEVVMRDFL